MEAPGELSSDVRQAREALAQGRYVRAQRAAASALNRIDPRGTGPGGNTQPGGTQPGGIDPRGGGAGEQALAASARAIAAMAELRLEPSAAAAADLAAALTLFESLLDAGCELDAAARTDFVRAGIAAEQPARVVPALVRSLESGYAMAPKLVVALAAALRAEHDGDAAVDLLGVAHRCQPNDVDLAVEFADAARRCRASAAGTASLEAAVLLAHEGEHGRAERYYRRALTELPASPDAVAGLAQVLLAQDRPGEALSFIAEHVAQRASTNEIEAVRARALADTGAVDEAVEVATTAMKTFGEGQPLIGALVQVLIAAGEPERAAPWIERGLGRDPHDPDLLLARGQVLLARGDAAGAAAILRPLADEFPESVDVWLALVAALTTTGEDAAATRALSEAMAAHPDDPDLRRERDRIIGSYLEFATEHFNDPDPASTKTRLECVLALDPDNGDAHGLLGVVLRWGDDLQRSLEHLDRARELRPDCGWIVGTRGQVLSALGSPEALDELRRAAQLDDSLAWVHIEIGEAYRIAHRYEEARVEVVRATDLEPDNAWGWATRGAVELLCEDWEQARTSLDRAIELDPGYGWALAVKANLLVIVDEMDEALRTIDRVREAERENSWAWGLKAWLLNVTSGDSEAEEAAARIAVSLAPDDMYLHLRLGEALIRRGRDAEADREFHRAIDLTSTQDRPDPETMANLAWCHLRLGGYAEAVNLLTASAARDYTDIVVQFELGLALLCAGRADPALEQYESAAQMVRAKPHAGHRRYLIRIARHDLRSVLRRGQVTGEAGVDQVERLLTELADGQPATGSARS